MGSYDLCCRAKPGRTYGVASPTSVMMGDITFPTFKAIAEELGLWHSHKLTPYPNATLTNGATIRFRTAEDPERMRGPNMSGWWLDEASLMPVEAFRISIASLREQGEQGWLSATFTPRGKYHWTYDTFGKQNADGSQATPDTALFRARTRDNPFNPPDFEKTISLQYPGTFMRQELGGEFVSIEGAWWGPEYFPDSMWFDEWPKELTGLVFALDPALGRESKNPTVGRGTNANPILKREGDYSALVALCRDRSNTLWVEADLERRNDTKTVKDSIAFGNRVSRETGCSIDGFGVESVGFQEVLANQLIEAVRGTSTNFNLHKIETGGVPKDVRIRRLSEWLATGRLRFRNTPGTQLLVRHLQEFPVGLHDDGPDALEQAKRLSEMLWEGKRR